MGIQFRDFEIRAKLPEFESSLPVYFVHSPSLEDRKLSIDLLRQSLDLGDLQSIGVNRSTFFESDRGHIQYYRPSGALWARNGLIDKQYKDERRPWKVIKNDNPKDPDDYLLSLDKADQSKLVQSASGIFKKANLLGEEAYLAGVEVEQVTQFNEKGKELGRFPGEATVKYLYRLNGIKVLGSGAKSYAFFNPGDKSPQLSGIFHCWRQIKETRSIQMVKVEESIGNALSRDEEIDHYWKQQYRFKLTEISLGYYAMPPFEYQEYVFPVVHLIGAAIHPKNPQEGFEFARYCHAAPPASYVKEKLFADYLNCRL